MAVEYNKRLAVNASIVMGATIISRITGFFREMLVPAKFGVGNVTDVYEVAFKFPDLMFSLLIGGAISAALIPILSGSVSKGEEKDGWGAISRFMNITILVMVATCIIGSFFSEQLVVLLAQGWDPNDPEKLEMIRMAAKLTRILFPSVAFLMMAGFTNAVLYSYQRFAAAALGPALYNVLCICSIQFLSSSNKEEYYRVDRVVYGVMFSSLTYFLFQASFAWKNIRGNYVFSFDPRNKGFQRVFRVAIPSLISSSVSQFNTMISSSIASAFALGSLTALRVADRTWQMPFGIIAQSMGIALLPNLSGKIANNDTDGYKDSLLQGIKSVLLLTIPCTFACIVLNQMIMRTLFLNSAKVTEADIALMAAILACYSTSLITQSMNTILMRAFYAFNETRTPMMTGVTIIGFNIVLSVLFFQFTVVGVKGMALAYSISSFAHTWLLVRLLNKKMYGLNVMSGMFSFFKKTFLAAAIMSVGLWLMNLLIPDSFIIGPVSVSLKIHQVLVLALNVVVGAAIYFFVTIRAGVGEAVMLYVTVFGRVRNLLRRLRGPKRPDGSR